MTDPVLVYPHGVKRLLLALLALFSVAIARADDSYTVLGPIEMQLAGGHGKAAFVAGTRANLVSVADGKTIFEIQGKKYELPTDQAKIYFESGDVGAKFMLGEAFNAVKDTKDLTHPSCVNVPKAEGCPANSETGSQWTDDAARRAALLCPIEPAEIIKRSDVKPYSDSCRNDVKPLNIDKSKTWKTCASAPVCSEKEAQLARKQSALRRKSEQLHCAHHPRPKNEYQKEDTCLVPFDKPITKIVVHQTDTQSDRGPNEAFNWHRDRGFGDISYHYIISKDASGKWRIFEGRPKGYVGAHGGPGANDDSLGIAIAGCYQTGEVKATSPCKSNEDRPPEEAVKLLTNLVAKLKAETLGPDGKPSIKEVVGHGQHRFAQTGCHTNCPSPSCQMLVNRLQERFFGDTK